VRAWPWCAGLFGSLHNHESRRRQYALTDRARALGWSEVVIVDDDLGRSGGGVERPGFERLLLAICEARVGITLAVEASRLARNGRDWHTLLEFCGLVGTMSEMELSLLRQRSLEALRQKARRGELFFTVAVGYRQGAARSRRTSAGHWSRFVARRDRLTAQIEAMLPSVAARLEACGAAVRLPAGDPENYLHANAVESLNRGRSRTSASRSSGVRPWGWWATTRLKILSRITGRPKVG
jgi:hypothetical protein